MEDWTNVFAMIPDYLLDNIQGFVAHLQQIEVFFGLHIVDTPGFTLTGMVIPALVLITSFVSSWLMQKKNHDPNAEDRIKTQQKIMLYIMPVIMTAFTFSVPLGVGIFWITSQLCQIVQDLILLKKDGIPIDLPFVKKKVTTVPSVKK